MYCSSIVAYNESYSHKGWRFTNITRSFNIIYYIYGGTGYFKTDKETIQFKKGHLYILPTNRVYTLFQNESDNLQHMYIHAYIQPEINTLMEIDVSKDKFIAYIVQQMKRYIMSVNTIYIKKLTEMLFSYLTDIDAYKNENENFAFKIKDYIDKNFLLVFKNNDLPQMFNYSNSHITRIFKSYYNITPHQYCKHIIMEYVTSLLKQNYPVKYIAQSLNFSSPENFSRFFKQNYGCSPYNYKKNM